MSKHHHIYVFIASVFTLLFAAGVLAYIRVERDADLLVRSLAHPKTGLMAAIDKRMSVMEAVNASQLTAFRSDTFSFLNRLEKDVAGQLEDARLQTLLEEQATRDEVDKTVPLITVSLDGLSQHLTTAGTALTAAGTALDTHLTALNSTVAGLAKPVAELLPLPDPLPVTAPHTIIFPPVLDCRTSPDGWKKQVKKLITSPARLINH